MAKKRISLGEHKKWLGVAPLFDPWKGKTIIKPPSKGRGYWAGAPSAMFDDDTGDFYLYYRLRKPRPIRGGEIRIDRSPDGVKFKTVWKATREDFRSKSIEKSCLLKCPDGKFRLYVSYVDPKDQRWRVDMLEANSPEKFDPAKRVKILTAADIKEEGVKDPAVYVIGGTFFMFLSYARKPKRISKEKKKRMHATADVYNTGLIKSSSGLAISTDGVAFGWVGDIFSPRDEGWDSYASRIGAIVYIPPVYTAFYDGSAHVKENYEERTGIAVSLDLPNFFRLTSDGPILTSPHGSGCLRYIDVFNLDGELWYYYEYARADGSHELRLNRVKV